MASSSDQQSSQSSPQRPRASRIMDTVKRSLNPSSTPKKRYQDYSKSGMQSTYEESNPTSLQQFRDPEATSTSRPTIEQIAMGLHVSRTPHLRPLAASPYAFSQRNSAPHSTKPYDHHHHRSTPITLPPPPTRSSMKKPSTTVTSSSGSPALTPAFSSGIAVDIDSHIIGTVCIAESSLVCCYQVPHVSLPASEQVGIGTDVARLFRSFIPTE
ncbi:hypothetical protein NLJ89_g2857 [Agrocybe chaxingu]|uniref:Uncharacterized protein n=1 Tax=Agrocybe chaxingu TaxID=84603 RepID=A0A9W8MXT2_9AGAR|nr:hypothetical protein NLJ89_g2857 [Agrocybe chaxingu]